MLDEIDDVDHCKVVPFVLKKLFAESRAGGFTSGEQVQEYFFGVLKENESSLGYRLSRKKKTSESYPADSEDWLTEDERGSCGIFDIWVEYKNLYCAVVIQCPRDEIIDDAESYRNCIRSNCLKLSKEDLHVKILMQFINKPAQASKESIIEILKEFPDINYASFRLLKQDELSEKDLLGVGDIIIHPDAWIIL